MQERARRAARNVDSSRSRFLAHKPTIGITSFYRRHRATVETDARNRKQQAQHKSAMQNSVDRRRWFGHSRRRVSRRRVGPRSTCSADAPTCNVRSRFCVCTRGNCSWWRRTASRSRERRLRLRLFAPARRHGKSSSIGCVMNAQRNGPWLLIASVE